MTDNQAIKEIYFSMLRKQGEMQKLFENSDCEYGKGILEGLELAIGFVTPIVYKPANED